MKKIYALLMTTVLCILLITPANVNAAVLSKEKATMEVDSTLKLRVQGSKESIIWSTSKKSVASVNSSGIVTAKAEGKAKITATIGEEEYVCTVTVVNSNKAMPTTTPTPAPVEEYPDGIYKIGKDMPEGEYVIFKTPYAESGYMRLSQDNVQNIIIKDGGFVYNTIITVKNGEYLKLTDAYAVPIDKAEVKVYSEGTFKVGTHIPAGTYTVTEFANKNGYYFVLQNNLQLEYQNRVEIETSCPVTVMDGQYLVLKNCAIYFEPQK